MKAPRAATSEVLGAQGLVDLGGAGTRTAGAIAAAPRNVRLDTGPLFMDVACFPVAARRCAPPARTARRNCPSDAVPSERSETVSNQAPPGVEARITTSRIAESWLTIVTARPEGVQAIATSLASLSDHVGQRWNVRHV